MAGDTTARAARRATAYPAKNMDECVLAERLITYPTSVDRWTKADQQTATYSS
jgi:hypothetical protein